MKIEKRFVKNMMVWSTGGECKFENDNDREKTSAFEHELQDKGLYANYTDEEEASYNQEDSPDKYKCSHYGDGVWNDNTGKCDIKDEEKTAYEDAVYDDPEDSDRYPKVCQPWLFEDD